jgi:diguanylate cyclase (GGDEF)-like protein
VDEGLPHSTVRAIAQTPDGYVWFGTPEGVARFDGLQFDVYDSRLFAPLRGAGIYSLKATKDGTLIIGTRGRGVWRFRDNQLSRVASASIASGGGAIAEDRQGRLWLSLDAEGLARIEGSAVRTFTRAEGLPSNTVRALLAHADGTVWVGTNRGVARIDGDTLHANPLGATLEGASITALAADQRGRLWIATASQGLLMWNGERLTRPLAALLSGAREPVVTNLLEDRDQTLWIGTTEGVLRVRADRLERFTTKDGLSSNTVRSFFEDGEGGLWVGTDRGVNRFRAGVIRGFGARQGLSEEFARAVLEDRNGTTWVATSDGLFAFGKGAPRRYAVADGLIDNSVLSLAEDASGRLWVGTYGGGVHRRNGARFEPVGEAIRKAGEAVRAIAVGEGGAVWVGTFAGLFRLDANNARLIEKFDSSVGLPSEQINALHVQDNGRLWIGTREGLLMREADGRITRASAMGTDTNVLTLSPGAEGRLWVGTGNGVGLVHTASNPPLVAPPTSHRLLPTQSYFNVLEDGRGAAWICGNRGLLRMPLDWFLKPQDARSTGLTDDVFGRNDGMPTAQCNGATQPSAWRARDGRLWFATARGLAEVDPAASLPQSGAPPQVLIKSLTLNGAPFDADFTRDVVLPPGSQRLQIEFIGISLSAADKLRYEFRLVGHEDQWIDAKADTKAVFTNLPSGRYRFEARARFGSGAPGARLGSFELVQSPRLIETWWFRVLLGMGLIGAIGAALGARVRYLEHQRLVLSETVDARTAELRTEKQKLEAVNDERTRLLVQVADSARAFERLAKEDSLTGLANRRELDRILATEFARAARSSRPLAVALADVDHFKRINDDFSHAMGDAVLKRIADALKVGVRKIDCVGRYGGEEFLLVLPEADIDVAMQVCERLRQAVANGLGNGPDGAPLPKVTMSFGLAVIAQDASHERLIARADAKLYEAKNAGRNRVVA